MLAKEPSIENIEMEGIIPALWSSQTSEGGKQVKAIKYRCQYGEIQKIHGQRSLVGYSLWGGKESDMIRQLSTHNTRRWKWTKVNFLKEKIWK